MHNIVNLSCLSHSAKHNLKDRNGSLNLSEIDAESVWEANACIKTDISISASNLDLDTKCRTILFFFLLGGDKIICIF